MSNQRQKLLRQIGSHIHNSWAAANILRHVHNSLTNGGTSVRNPDGSITIQARDLAALHLAVINMLISVEQANHTFEQATPSQAPIPKCTP